MLRTYDSDRVYIAGNGAGATVTWDGVAEITYRLIAGQPEYEEPGPPEHAMICVLPDESPVPVADNGSVRLFGVALFPERVAPAPRAEVRIHDGARLRRERVGEYLCRRCRRNYLSRTIGDGTECRPRSRAQVIGRRFRHHGPADRFLSALAKHRRDGRPIRLYAGAAPLQERS